MHGPATESAFEVWEPAFIWVRRIQVTLDRKPVDLFPDHVRRNAK